MDKGPKETFFQRRPIKGQYLYENVLNITNLQRNEVQLDNTPLCYNEKDKRSRVLVRVCRKGSPCTLVDGIVNLYNHYRKKCGGSSKIKSKTSM
jgi:hypothetical protein